MLAEQDSKDEQMDKAFQIVETTQVCTDNKHVNVFGRQ
jgi:hypothetical protein